MVPKSSTNAGERLYSMGISSTACSEMLWWANGILADSRTDDTHWKTHGLMLQNQHTHMHPHKPHLWLSLLPMLTGYWLYAYISHPNFHSLITCTFKVWNTGTYKYFPNLFSLRNLPEYYSTFYTVHSWHTIRYDTRCYFNMHSKADISQLNLPHRTKNWKVERRKTKK